MTGEGGRAAVTLSTPYLAHGNPLFDANLALVEGLALLREAADHFGDSVNPAYVVTSVQKIRGIVRELGEIV